MSTWAAVGMYVAYALWRRRMDRKHEAQQQAILAAVAKLTPRIEHLERITNTSPSGLPKPLDL